MIGDAAIVPDRTFKADQALAQYRVVTYSSTEQFVTYGTAKANNIAGVTQHATTASGDTVKVRQIGLSKITISAAVTKGIPLLISDSQGRVSNNGGVTGDGIVGVPEEGNPGSAGTSGDQITCFLQIRRA
jgi:hypothetical protein